MILIIETKSLSLTNVITAIFSDLIMFFFEKCCIKVKNDNDVK